MTFALRTLEQIAPKDNCQLAALGRLALLSPRGRDGRASASEGKGVGLGEGRVRDNLRLIDAVGAHPSPQSSPLQQGERPDKSKGIQIDNQRTLPRRGNRITFVLSWRSKKGQYEPASSSLGVSRELHLTLFPQGPIATRACVAKTQI